jgi:molybdenum cofactor synthesis domain-containing protein
MGAIVAICLSERKGTAKKTVPEAAIIAGHGLENDAHAGNGHRQVSLISLERIEEFRRKGAIAPFGCFGENLVVAGIDCAALPVGTRFACGDAVLELTQIGKECHTRCQIFHTMGECIMPVHGVFARALQGGVIRVGDAITASLPGARPYTAAVLTLSDKGAAGQRADESGKAVMAILEEHGYSLAHYAVLPDDRAAISAEMERLADVDGINLILTTGGTGFAKRDVTPEATLAVVTRLCPGIPEAMRALSMGVTRRAMLTRAAAGIRGETLIVNLPGSPRAVRECLSGIITELRHGLDILTGKDGECART